MGLSSSLNASCWMWRIGQCLERQVSRRYLTFSTSLGVERGPHSGSPSTRPCCRSTRRRMGGSWVSEAM